MLHCTAHCLPQLHIKEPTWRGTRERNSKDLVENVQKLSSEKVLPDNGGAKRHSSEQGEGQAVQASCSTASTIPVQDTLASVDGLPSIWPGLELDPLGTRTKDEMSDFN